MSDQVESASVNKSCLSSQSDDSSKLSLQAASGGSGYEADDEISLEAHADPSIDSEVDMPIQVTSHSPTHHILPPLAAIVGEGFGYSDGTQSIGDGLEEGTGTSEVSSNLKRHRVISWGSPLKRARRRF